MSDLITPPLVTFLIGIVSGWLLFELTEWRRTLLARGELRRALVAELESAEVFVCVTVCKYARLCRSETDVKAVAKEIRWFYTVGRHRMQDTGILSDLPPMPQAYESLSDNQLISLYSTIDETIGLKIITPVVESALSGQLSGLNARQIQALGMVRWQAHLLEQSADSMREFFHMSFTLTDEANHKIAIDNHDRSTSSYAQRARTLLRAIRAALQQIR